MRTELPEAPEREGATRMARHTPAGDTSFMLSLLKHGAAAIGLVVVVSLAFWGVGKMRTGDVGDDVIAGEQTIAPGETTDDVTSGASEEAPATSGEAEQPAGEDTEPAPAAEETASEQPAAEATEEPTEDATEQATQAPAAQAVDPASVSVQILDAVLDDAGVGAQGWADQMEADGYRIVVVNKASKVYEVTTVFYTPGNEAAARQIAEQYGFERVDLRPDNLSDSVSVHVVIGKDA